MNSAVVVSALTAIPDGLRVPLLASYAKIVRNFQENRWDASELNGGKLCECAYSILKGYLDGTYAPAPFKPSNMNAACQALENSPSTFPKSVRVQIPRMVVALYDFRNNRGVGHVGGDVDANHMDALCVLHMSKWIICELVRIFHRCSTREASEVVEMLSTRTLPVIWAVGEKRRVLDTSLTLREQTLLLLYHANLSVLESALCDWVEKSAKAAVYRRDVLRPAHRDRLIEYDQAKGTVMLSPKGIDLVEKNLLKRELSVV